MTTVDGRTESQWVFEERDIGMNPTAMILVRVVVGKVASLKKVEEVLREVPVCGDEPGWNCVRWLGEALERLRADPKALSSSSCPPVGWEVASGAAMEYVRRKEGEHRFDGQASPGRFDMNRVATYDLLRGEEVIA